jgi:hypothetical protein
MNRLKSSGAVNAPCGTPALISAGVEIAEPIPLRLLGKILG